jgi:hypothetical protein
MTSFLAAEMERLRIIHPCGTHEVLFARWSGRGIGAGTDRSADNRCTRGHGRQCRPAEGQLNLQVISADLGAIPAPEQLTNQISNIANDNFRRFYCTPDARLSSRKSCRRWRQDYHYGSAAVGILSRECADYTR